jgi:hypothetical protein
MRLFPALSIAVSIAALCLCAQGQNPPGKDAQPNETKGLPPRTAPSDYQAHVQAGAITIAAEFAGHGVPTPEGPLTAEDYVVVELGLFGPAGAHTTLSINDFSLRINGKKTPLSSQSAELVAHAVKDPEWAPPVPAESKSKTSIGAGGGQKEPGALPPVVHVPIELLHAMAQRVLKASLPEGDRALPVAGLIFFQYRGKAESIRSLQLLYTGPAGKANLALQP